MLIIFTILFVGVHSIQGLVSIGTAIRTYEILTHYLKKHDLAINIQLANMSQFWYLDEFTNLKQQWKCTHCNKQFKNSSYLQLHHYKQHINQSVIENVIQLNHFCDFTNCLQIIGHKTILDIEVRTYKCYKFGLTFIEHNLDNYHRINQFCDDIIKDSQEHAEYIYSITDQLLLICKFIGFVAYIFVSLKLLSLLNSHLTWLRKAKQKYEYINTKYEHYNVNTQ